MDNMFEIKCKSYIQVCTDINECENSNGGCVENSDCINTPVSDALWSFSLTSRALSKMICMPKVGSGLIRCKKRLLPVIISTGSDNKNDFYQLMWWGKEPLWNSLNQSDLNQLMCPHEAQWLKTVKGHRHDMYKILLSWPQIKNSFPGCVLLNWFRLNVFTFINLLPHFQQTMAKLY